MGNAAKKLMALGIASTALVLPGTASAENARLFECSATVVGQSYDMSWTDLGTNTYYIRHNGHFNLKVTNETTATRYVGGTWVVRAWVNGEAIDATCATDNDDATDFVDSCIISDDGTQIIWDDPDADAENKRFYIRQNGSYVGAISDSFSYPTAGLENTDNLVVRYWDKGTALDAECEGSDIPIHEFSEVAFPDEYKRASHGEHTDGGQLHSTAGTTYLTLNHYSDGTYDHNGLGAYSDGLELTSADDAYGDLLARNDANGIEVYIGHDNGSWAATAVEDGSTTVYELSDATIRAFRYSNSAVVTDSGYVVSEGAELMFLNLETGENGILRDINGARRADVRDLAAIGDEVTFVTTIGQQRTMLAINPETLQHRVVSGSWASRDDVVASVHGQDGTVSSWIADLGSSAVLRTSAGIEVEVSSVELAKAQIVSNTDGLLFIAVQPATIGAKTIFMTVDSSTGTKTILGHLQTRWGVGSSDVSIGIAGSDFLILADGDADNFDTLWTIS